MRSSRLNQLAGALAALVSGSAVPLHAQTASQAVTQSGDVVAEVIYACYAPLTGILYLIKQAGLQPACLTIGPIVTHACCRPACLIKYITPVSGA